MVTFKPEFLATRYPGYFFNTEDELLYSMKVDGVLKPLKQHKPNRFNHMYRFQIKLKDGSKVTPEGGYFVSVKGQSRFLSIEELKDLTQHDATIPVKGEEHEPA